MKNHLLYLLFSLALLSSCNTSKEIIYFQDVEVNSPKAVAPPQDITVQPKDQISIIVSSKDPELAALFNLTRVQQRVGSTGLNNNNNNGEISGYTLDDKRDLDEKHNDIPDILARWENLEAEKERARTEKSFMVPKEEIEKNEYDFSFNKYTETVYERKEYPPTSEILADLAELNKEIASGLKELEAMLGKDVISK